jgi:hypothetical protein
MSFFIDQNLYNQSLLIVTDEDMQIVDTKNDSIDLRKKNIKEIVMRTVVNMHITRLDISHNPLTFFPDIFTLRYLNCGSCKIKVLPTYMPVLEELDCSNNLIKFIPAYANLHSLNCSDNFINSVPYKINFLIANNCPILTIHQDHALRRRSGIIKNKKFTWITTNTVETKYALIDWHSATTKINFKSAFLKKLAKFLFHS